MNTRVGALLTTVLAVAAFLPGCSSFLGPDEDPPIDRTIRQNVLDGVEDAYSTGNVGVLLECLGDDLRFYLEPNTVIADPALPDYWGVGTETLIHEDAFGSRTAAASVSLTLTPERDPLEIEGPGPGDPSEWEYYEQYSLSAVVSGITYQVNGYATFTLATHEGDTTAQGDPLWSIVEWSDTGDVPCRPDVTNWTELKLLFGEGAGGYPTRSTAPNAVEKLRQAYEAMDALAFTDCLADTFRFCLNPDDYNDPGNDLPEFWELDTESTIAWNMFGPGATIDNVQLSLVQLGTPVQIPAPGGGEPGWEYVYNVDLYVHVTNWYTFWASAASRFQMFADPDETGPSGETLWEITKWEDIDSPSRAAAGDAGRGGRVEESSWGGIKALYR